MWRKLGIREGSTVRLVNPPDGFEASLAPLPPGVRVTRRGTSALDVAVVFVTRQADLRRRFGPLARSLDPSGRLWVGWPKKASSIRTDLDFDAVQRVGLSGGLVDNKSGSLTDAYQGLQFVYRLTDRPRSGAAGSPTRTPPGTSTSP
jgi:hypothetical protein